MQSVYENATKAEEVLAKADQLISIVMLLDL
jgi:hypothetical protein